MKGRGGTGEIAWPDPRCQGAARRMRCGAGRRRHGRVGRARASHGRLRHDGTADGMGPSNGTASTVGKTPRPAEGRSAAYPEAANGSRRAVLGNRIGRSPWGTWSRKRRVNSVRDRDPQRDSPCSGESRPRHRRSSRFRRDARGSSTRSEVRKAWRRPPIRCGSLMEIAADAFGCERRASLESGSPATNCRGGRRKTRTGEEPGPAGTPRGPVSPPAGSVRADGG